MILAAAVAVAALTLPLGPGLKLPLLLCAGVELEAVVGRGRFKMFLQKLDSKHGKL